MAQPDRRGRARDRHWRSHDGQFDLCVSARAIDRMLQQCRRAHPRETGSILVGHYPPSLACAVVTATLPAPRDSRAGPRWFERGVRGLQARLDALWHAQRRAYYLGEWHYHPSAVPRPSATDNAQMRRIADDPDYRCPEPLLLLIGGDATRGWRLAALVYPAGTDGIPLLPVACESEWEVGGGDASCPEQGVRSR